MKTYYHVPQGMLNDIRKCVTFANGVLGDGSYDTLLSALSGVNAHPHKDDENAISRKEMVHVRDMVGFLAGKILEIQNSMGAVLDEDDNETGQMRMSNDAFFHLGECAASLDALAGSKDDHAMTLIVQLDK